MAASGSAQGTLAGLQGVVNASGSPLRDCTVSAYQIDVAQQKAVQTIVSRTQEDGSYAFRSLRPGSYVLLVTCGGERVFQGMADVKAGILTHRDIALADPFTGKWQLNLSKSTLGPYSLTKEETRQYSRVGDLVTLSWTRLLESNTRATSGSYQFKCDGREYGTTDQRITCRFRSGNSVEGSQKPPLSFYVRSVQGNVMRIATYADPDHRKGTATLVYDRAQ